MNAKKRQATTKSVIEDDRASGSKNNVMSDMTYTLQGTPKRAETLEPCMCFPLSTLCLTPQHSSQTREDGQGAISTGDEYLVQATPQLNYALRTRLKECLARTGPLSLLLLHVSQLEQPALTSSTKPVQQRYRYHVAHGVLAQVLSNMQRAIRHHDQLLLEEGVGVAMLFPSVDEQGIQNIIERVYRSICLLQAETIVPPLVRVTDIVLGCGTVQPQTTPHLDTEQVIEALLASAGRVARRLLLRPALSPSLWETMPSLDANLSQPASHMELTDITDRANISPLSQNQYTPELNNLSPYVPPAIQRQSVRKKAVHTTTDADAGRQSLAAPDATPTASSIPFLHLPTSLSPRLKHLIPYTIAQQLRCAPVGRDHHKLTVAMADPTDDQAIQCLQEVTGLTIFPVSCEVDALLTLLTEGW